jgi:photosystem II stability/assembly factor-like uncharacterized protein
VAVGASGTILTSPNGISWTTKTFDSTHTYTNIIYANSMFVIIGESGTIVTSADGATWGQRTSTVSSNLYSIV